MAPRQIRGINRAKVSITNKTLEVDNPYIVYQINNIATLNKEFKELPRQANPRLKAAIDIIRSMGQPIKQIIIITIGCFLMTSIIQIFIRQSEAAIIIGLSIFIVSCSVVLFKLIKKVMEIVKIAQDDIARNKLPNKLYGVSISTNDGKSVIIYDYRERARDNILSKLFEVMENQDVPASYVFQVEGDFVSGNKKIDVQGDYVDDQTNYYT